MSQYKLAKIAGISRGYLNEIEKGLKIPRLPMLEKIAKALKVRMGDLIQDDYVENVETIIQGHCRVCGQPCNGDLCIIHKKINNYLNK